jgi:hypothetical protein
VYAGCLFDGPPPPPFAYQTRRSMQELEPKRLQVEVAAVVAGAFAAMAATFISGHRWAMECLPNKHAANMKTMLGRQSAPLARLALHPMRVNPYYCRGCLLAQ